MVPIYLLAFTCFWTELMQHKYKTLSSNNEFHQTFPSVYKRNNGLGGLLLPMSGFLKTFECGFLSLHPAQKCVQMCRVALSKYLASIWYQCQNTYVQSQNIVHNFQRSTIHCKFFFLLLQLKCSSELVCLKGSHWWLSHTPSLPSLYSKWTGTSKKSQEAAR